MNDIDEPLRHPAPIECPDISGSGIVRVEEHQSLMDESRIRFDVPNNCGVAAYMDISFFYY